MTAFHTTSNLVSWLITICNYIYLCIVGECSYMLYAFNLFIVFHVEHVVEGEAR